MNKSSNEVWLWTCLNCNGTQFKNEIDFDLVMYVDECLNCGQKYGFSQNGILRTKQS